MKQKNFVDILFILIVAGVIFLFATNDGQTVQPDVKNNVSISTENKFDQSEFFVGGWIPPWASKEGFESVKNNSDKINNISPVWFDLKSDGSLDDKKPQNYKEIINLAKEKSMSITPSIALFEHNILTSALNSESNFDRHLSQSLDIAKIDGVDGIDIDYEAIKLSDRDKYFDYLTKLKEGLSKNNKILSVTVLPKWGENINYSSFRETREVQDWKKISDIADQVRIMAYDYTWQSAPFSGPISPISWVKKILEYSKDKIPSNKTILSLPLYGYEKFEVREDFVKQKLPSTLILENNRGGSNSSRAYSFNNINKALSENEGEIVRQEDEVFYYYSKLNNESRKFENRLLVFVDREGLQKRIDLAKEYKIAGIAFWRFGDNEDILQGLTF
jgi:spore germination protein YaaH